MDHLNEQINITDFEAIYEEYYDRIYKCAFMLLLNKEDAEDVTSETFMSAYAFWGTYDPSRSSVGTWLTRIAHNSAVNLLRSAAYTKRAEMPETWEQTDTKNDFTDRVEARETAVWLYSRLTMEEREFLNMRYVMELKDSEIGEFMGVPTKTVNKRYQRLLLRCRKILNDNDK